MFDLKFYKQVIDVLYHLECENQDEFPNEHQSILKKKKIHLYMKLLKIHKPYK